MPVRPTAPVLLGPAANTVRESFHARCHDRPGSAAGFHRSGKDHLLLEKPQALPGPKSRACFTPPRICYGRPDSTCGAGPTEGTRNLASRKAGWPLGDWATPRGFFMRPSWSESKMAPEIEFEQLIAELQHSVHDLTNASMDGSTQNVIHHLIRRAFLFLFMTIRRVSLG
jgi:hypothetical protein